MTKVDQSMLRQFESWVFYIFLFSIPISIRHIFGYEPFNFIEWEAVYIYATDILLLILLGFWFVNWKNGNRQMGIKTADWALLAFVAVAGLSISNALNNQTAIFQWAKLIEGVALYFYIKEYAVKRFELVPVLKAIVWGGAFQAVIGIIQFTMQGSLGLKYLGESPLVPAMSGIAAFFVDGIKIIRAYGTTPHSNILALYLFGALLAFYALSILKIGPPAGGWKLKIARSERGWRVLHTLILWGFFLTFSRTIIGVWLVAFGAYLFLVRFYPKFKSEFLNNPELLQRVSKILLTTITVGVVFVLAYWPYVVDRSYISSTDEAVQLRVLYNQKSMAGGDNMFGLGMGNFVPWLMTQDLHFDRGLYQPVHNIYLLIYSETGPFGIALFILFMALLIYDVIAHIKCNGGMGWRCRFLYAGGLVFFTILVFGLFDHYLWTIQSGRLIFWMTLGLFASLSRFDKF